ncbi:MAG: carboxymuconolactone decarboxylase family protein [Candidatus Dadabacteria bacterium]|nr:carboxymuconolactone decarboxylase family protein [Candidatus Dadabacteria bacterium]
MTRYKQGIEKFREIKGEGAEKSLERLESLSPDLARYIMEFAFNDIYRRPGLDLRSREIATIAALTALGNAPQQIKVHTVCALNVGVTKEEVMEVILQMALYAGFPAAINAMQAVNEAFDEFDKRNPGAVKPANDGIDIQRKKAISA